MPSFIAQVRRRIAWWLALVLVTALGCSACSGDDLPVHASQRWTPGSASRLAVSDTVQMGAVVIDRVQFAGRNAGDAVAGGALIPAWVELINPGNEPVRLAGFGLSDQPALPFKWVFPPEAMLAAGGRLRVWLNTETDVVASVLVSAPNGTPTGVVLDSTTAARQAVAALWCRRAGSESGARFRPCAAGARAADDGRPEELAALDASHGPAGGHE